MARGVTGVAPVGVSCQPFPREFYSPRDEMEVPLARLSRRRNAAMVRQAPPLPRQRTSPRYIYVYAHRRRVIYPGTGFGEATLVWPALQPSREIKLPPSTPPKKALVRDLRPRLRASLLFFSSSTQQEPLRFDSPCIQGYIGERKFFARERIKAPRKFDRRKSDLVLALSYLRDFT